MPSRSAPGFHGPDVSALDMFAVMAALADPVRRGIVVALAKGEQAGKSAIACGGFDLPVSKATAARHFRMLREVGLIEQWAEGNRKLNRLRRSDLDARFPGLIALVLAEATDHGRGHARAAAQVTG